MNLPFTSVGTTYYNFSITVERVTHSLPVFGYLAASTNYLLLFEEAALLANSPAALDWTSVRDPYGDMTLQFSYEIA